MTLQQRIELLVRLGEHIRENGEEWQLAREKAFAANAWFLPEFIEQSGNTIAQQFLQKNQLDAWATYYHLPETTANPTTVGVVTAGNIPMVGMHDVLSVFISGHKQAIKLSNKDEVLMKHVLKTLTAWDVRVANYILLQDKIAGCEAYIATGSNNTGRYFDYYFGKFPNIIRRNRTSVAILLGNETNAELALLADDIQSYFGLGCRNVTKLYVPIAYNFEPLLKALDAYSRFGDYHKYRHNYDYQLALLMMSNTYYMTNGTILLSQNEGLFTAISRVNFEYYNNIDAVMETLQNNNDVQCIVGQGKVAFGQAQIPGLFDYADGVDIMAFLNGL